MKTLRRCASIVRGDRKSCAATSLLDRPCGHEAGDLELLRGELVDRARVALAGGLAGGAQLRPRALGQRLGAVGLERRERGAELRPRGGAAPLAAEVLAVVHAHAREVERARVVARARASPRSARSPRRPRRAARGSRPAAARAKRAPECVAHASNRAQRLARHLRAAGAHRRLDLVGQHQRRHHRVGVARALLRHRVEALERLRPAGRGRGRRWRARRWRATRGWAAPWRVATASTSSPYRWDSSSSPLDRGDDREHGVQEQEDVLGAQLARERGRLVRRDHGLVVALREDQLRRAPGQRVGELPSSPRCAREPDRAADERAGRLVVPEPERARGWRAKA